MTRMFRFAAAGALLLTMLAPTFASAGFEPCPWRVLISNRSDAVAPESQVYMQPMTEPMVYLVVQDATGGTSLVEYPIASAAIYPGTTFTFGPVEPTTGGSIIGWAFTAKMGVEPMPWRVYAMATPGEEPTAPPVLPASLLTPEYGLYAFASPGTLVGGVVMLTEAAVSQCPTDVAWKNHGQYVRCVALWVGDLSAAGTLTEEEADAIVQAAAESAVGK